MQARSRTARLAQWSRRGELEPLRDPGVEDRVDYVTQRINVLRGDARPMGAAKRLRLKRHLLPVHVHHSTGMRHEGLGLGAEAGRDLGMLGSGITGMGWDRGIWDCGLRKLFTPPPRTKGPSSHSLRK